MDGNGRWAQKRLLPRVAGHRQGVLTLEKIVDKIYDLGVKVLTVYAFSTENTARPKDEVKNLCSLIKEFFTKKLYKFIESQISIKIIGDIDFFTQDIKAVLNEAINKTASFKNKTFCLALNYGARDEIIRAVNKAIAIGKKLTQDDFKNLLDTTNIPDPEIIIRTGGDKRLSNFLLYQAAYSELFFTPDLWPDFTIKKLKEVITEFSSRDRRFGKVK